MSLTALLGPAISAGASLLGGFMGKESQEEQRAKNEALQREFAQNAIQWKVADAKKAGIHPLYAMGAPSISPAVSVQSDPLASSISSMGADIGRAMNAMSDPREKVSAVAEATQALQLENMRLRNDYIAAQIKKMTQAGSPPGVPVGTATSVEVDPKMEKNPRIVIGGEELAGDPEWSPAKVMEDAYGDDNIVASQIYGAIKMLKDWQYNNLVRDRLIPKGYSNQSGRRSGGGGW